MTLSESTAIKTAYANMYEKHNVCESSPAYGTDDDRFLFKLVHDEDITTSFRDDNEIIVTKNLIDNEENKAKFDALCKKFGFTYNLSEYDEDEEGYHLNPSEPLKSEIKRYFNRIDDFYGNGEFGEIRKTIRGISEFARALSKSASEISEEASNFDSSLDYDDMKKVGDLSFTLGAKMDYVYSYEGKLERLIKSLEKYRKYAIDKQN